jgi:moderate conductance mechanosensitive channel
VSGSVSRLGTLLPLLRHAVLIIIVVAGTIAVLERLGFNIGPLLSRARYLRGRHRLWRAELGARRDLGRLFPAGGCVSSRRVHPERQLQGTVEGFSVRSVKLRHHRGPDYTVPFGLLGAIQNQSRDWVIDKIAVGITYDSDLEKARKLISRSGWTCKRTLNLRR